MLDDSDQRPPATGEEAPSRIGADEWVAQEATRRRGQTGIGGRIAAVWESIPLTRRFGLVLLLLIFAPVVTGSQPFLDLIGLSNDAFILRIGARFLIFAMLAIGLNVVVGYAGLLDLGYVAFFGIAGYLYAYLSSDFIIIGSMKGIHLPTLVSLPLIVLATAFVGRLLGLVSLRLSGDYLAIVTLGFGQVFVQLALTATRVRVPWRTQPIDLTRGPNGINRLDEISLFGFTFETTLQYYYLFLALLVLIFVAVRHLNYSRIGRAWHSIRDDELAAEAMGTPTNRMKLLAFTVGAAIAAVAGVVDAAWQGNVVPVPRYSVLTLINLYAMVVLGGIGSLSGVVIGAFIFTVLPELLRSITLAGFLFYGAGLIGLLALLRPLRRFAALLAATVAGGLVVKGLVFLIAPSLDTGGSGSGSFLNRLVQSWLVIPESAKSIGNVVVVLAVLALLTTILVRRRERLFLPLLALSLYLSAFAWETRLALEPAATRIVIVGTTLVVLMIVRPQGLLGKAEVRVT